MKDVSGPILGYIIGGIGIGLWARLSAKVKQPAMTKTELDSFKSEVTEGLSSINKKLDVYGDAITMLLGVNDEQNHVQQSSLEVDRALIDAIESGVCNGNIKGARERNTAAMAVAKEAREEAQTFLVEHTLGKGA